MPRRVTRTRNGGTWTEARYWGHLRSALRNAFRYWKPIAAAKSLARAAPGRYQCAHCGNIFKSQDVEVDHILPAGSLRSLEDIAGFVERLTPEDPCAYQVLCHPCHTVKTNAERGRKGS